MDIEKTGNKMELDRLLEVFKYLSAPFDDPGSEEPARSGNMLIDSPDAVFQRVTEFCLKHVDFLESSKSLLNTETSSPTCSWKLACLILSALSKLKTTMEHVEAEQTEEEKSIDVLSIQSQIFVQKSVELVVGFGIVPYLLPGLGVPQKLRKMNPSVSHFFVDLKATSPYEQFLRLAHTLETLLGCSKHATLNALITPKYSSDLLAGLLQICKSPIALPKVYNKTEESKVGALSVEQYENVMQVREKLSAIMTEIFLANVPRQVLINSLFLIGATEKPRWISASCNDLLYEMILAKSGLIVVASTMVEVSGSCDTWKLMRVISSLMRSALLKWGPDHGKLCNLAEQCIQMVRQYQEPGSAGNKQDEKTEDKKSSASIKLPYGTNVELIHIGLFCGLTLMDMDFEFGKSVFWNSLFHHVVHLDTCQNRDGRKSDLILDSSPNANVSSSVQNVAMCVVYSELLLSLVKPMNVSLPLRLLQPVWSLLVQVFDACERYLRKPVQEPNVAASAEQLHHKLKDVLILLFEIYGSGAGENFVLPTNGAGGGGGKGNPTAAASATATVGTNISLSQTRPTPPTRSSRGELAKEKFNLCDFIMTLLLNQESNGVPTLNTFDLLFYEEDGLGQAEVRIVQTHQEMISGESDYNEVYNKYLDGICSCVSNEILKNEKLKGIWPMLFRQLVTWGTTRQDGGKAKASFRERSFKSDELPTRLEGADDVKVSLHECQKFITFRLLGELGDDEKILDEFGNADSMEETLSFLELLLNKFANEVSCSSEDLEQDAFDASQLIMYALGIIGALIDAASASVAAAAAAMSSQFGGSGSHLSSSSSLEINKEINELWDNLEMFVPHLRKLSQCSQPSLVRQGVPEMASGLLLSIGTRGMDHQSKSEFPLKTRFHQAMEDASSAMVHVKGHGLLELRRLIEQRDKETLQNEIHVLKLFRENLTNDDSYVYLMAIQGMAGLAAKFHKTVVPLLIKEYDFIISDGSGGDDDVDSCGNSGKGSGGSRNMYQQLDSWERTETRMKVGEILVKVIQKLNELAPSYRTPLTNVFLRLMRDEEPLIRTSALSNLGELCHLLRFSLGAVLTEVWFCVESLLSSEKDIHVRRAALHLLVLLLKGVQKDLSVKDILSDPTVSQHLRDVRRLLTRVEQCEGDLVAKTHCQLALQELELIVKKLLTPSNSLSYKIQILDL